MTLGNRLKLEREKRALSQGQLAKMCGWENGQSRVANYENDIRSPKLSDIVTLANKLNVYPEWLAFGGTDSPPRNNYVSEEAKTYGDIKPDLSPFEKQLVDKSRNIPTHLLGVLDSVADALQRDKVETLHKELQSRFPELETQNSARKNPA